MATSFAQELAEKRYLFKFILIAPKKIFYKKAPAYNATNIV